jgi:hypothetical protein
LLFFIGLLDWFTRERRMQGKIDSHSPIRSRTGFMGMTEKEVGMTEEPDGFDESNPYLNT